MSCFWQTTIKLDVHAEPLTDLSYCQYGVYLYKAFGSPCSFAKESTAINNFYIQAIRIEAFFSTSELFSRSIKKPSTPIMSVDREEPTLAYTLPFQLTQTIHRQVQDELSPEKEENRATAQGKVVVITGGGTGIGAVSLKRMHVNLSSC